MVLQAQWGLGFRIHKMKGLGFRTWSSEKSEPEVVQWNIRTTCSFTPKDCRLDPMPAKYNLSPQSAISDTLTTPPPVCLRLRAPSQRFPPEGGRLVGTHFYFAMPGVSAPLFSDAAFSNATVPATPKSPAFGYVGCMQPRSQSVARV